MSDKLNQKKRILFCFIILTLTACVETTDALLDKGFTYIEEPQYHEDEKLIRLSFDEGMILFSYKKGTIELANFSADATQDISGLYHPDTGIFEYYPDEVCNYDVEKATTTKGVCTDESIGYANTLKKMYEQFIKKQV